MRRIILALSIALTLSAIAAKAEADKWVRVVNQRNEFPIWQIFISSAGSDNWGPDQLGGTVLNAGDSETWNIGWNGCWVDLRAVTYTGLSVEKRGVNVCGGLIWTIYDN